MFQLRNVNKYIWKQRLNLMTFISSKINNTAMEKRYESYFGFEFILAVIMIRNNE